MKRTFDKELEQLKRKLLDMADRAQEMIGYAIGVLTKRDEKLSKNVLKLEKSVNQMEVEIEEEALKLLALRQPAASDLRLIMAVLKINNDLERVADQACNIAETSLFLLKEPPLISRPKAGL